MSGETFFDNLSSPSRHSRSNKQRTTKLPSTRTAPADLISFDRSIVVAGPLSPAATKLDKSVNSGNNASNRSQLHGRTYNVNKDLKLLCKQMAPNAPKKRNTFAGDLHQLDCTASKNYGAKAAHATFATQQQILSASFPAAKESRQHAVYSRSRSAKSDDELDKRQNHYFADTSVHPEEQWPEPDDLAPPPEEWLHASSSTICNNAGGSIGTGSTTKTTNVNRMELCKLLRIKPSTSTTSMQRPKVVAF